MSKDNGGPAFPVMDTEYNPDHEVRELTTIHKGMTLRDACAIAALPAIIAAYVKQMGAALGQITSTITAPPMPTKWPTPCWQNGASHEAIHPGNEPRRVAAGRPLPGDDRGGCGADAMSCEYVRQHYSVPAVIGRRVVVGGKPGIIAEDRGHYIGVNFDAHKPGVICNAHPTSEVEYGEMGTIRKMTRSQKRYQDYLRSESTLTFAEWIGAKR